METIVRDTHAVAPSPVPASRTRGRWVLAAAGLLILAQLAIRSWVVSGRNYYGDDLRILSLADQNRLLDLSYLTYDYDGQFMPGGLLLAGLVERVAPLEWWPAALTLVGMQLLASLALLRLLRVLLGDRPLLLVPLAFGLFTTITVGSFTWWAAALNSMPVQIGLAWFLADAVLLARTGSRRYAVSGTVALALTFCFYLKAVLIPWAGFGVVVLVLIRDRQRSPIVAAWRRGRALWIASLAVSAAWAAAYLATRTSPPSSGGGVDDVVETVVAGFRVLAASVLGGPSGWWNVRPASPAALYMPDWTVHVGALLLLAAFVWTCVRRRGAAAVWALFLVVPTAGLVLAGIGRGGLGLGSVAPLACRYFPVEAVLLPVAGALLATLPPRRGDGGTGGGGTGDGGTGGRAGRRPLAVGITAVATLAFVVAAVMSTLEQARAWQADRTGEYLAVARESLAAAGSAPMLDQQFPEDIIPPLAYPTNLFSVMLSPLEDRPPFTSWTSELRVLDEAGNLRPADVVPGYPLAAGPDPACGWPVAPGAGTAIALDGAAVLWDWTARLDYTADRAGSITVALGPGEPVRAEVAAGSNTVFVRVPGEGSTLQITSQTPGLTLCVQAGVVGEAVPR
ncbi:hypothetical protein [Blastococcus sp. SYSU DS0617]